MSVKPKGSNKLAKFAPVGIILALVVASLFLIQIPGSDGESRSIFSVDSNPISESGINPDLKITQILAARDSPRNYRHIIVSSPIRPKLFETTKVLEILELNGIIKMAIDDSSNITRGEIINVEKGKISFKAQTVEGSVANNAGAIITPFLAVNFRDNRGQSAVGFFIKRDSYTINVNGGVGPDISSTDSDKLYNVEIEWTKGIVDITVNGELVRSNVGTWTTGLAMMEIQIIGFIGEIVFDI